MRDTKKQARTLSPTIRDVARAAQVSVSTISRVFNHPELVSPEVTQHILSAVAKCGYIPNASARALASNSTRTVGAVMPTISSPIYSKIIDAIQRTLEESRFVLLVAGYDYSLEREFQSAKALIERGVDALILVGKSHEERLYELMKRKKIPVVLTCIYEPESQWPTIGWDNKSGGYKIASYVASLGHREFGVIGGIAADNDRASARVAGFLAGVNAHGLNVSEECIIQCRYDLAQSGDALRRLVLRAKPPTAILCGNDVLATGALLECLRLGIRVPRDISITGYDDLELSSQLVPALTTLRVPAEEIGRSTAETLIRILERNLTPLHIRFELELMERATTAHPKAIGMSRRKFPA